ncbi:hypothetical protein KP509_28G035500 [Ceratopteris richardii]|uniref:Uncharacterized protein n=1 Tax=Ceratopteris richardii TaxID=49495 RepID=A0A8T2RCF9_CERRI|nr:hypothetical protein KP509_28G035500 [Ceratopteris richardii]
MGSEAVDHSGAPCEGVGDSDGALESWEMEDAEATLKKFIALSTSCGNQQVGKEQVGAPGSPRAQISLMTSSSSSSEAGRSDIFKELVDSDEVDSFLREALQGKDRLTILRLEQEVERFMRNHKLQQLEFQPMPSSYLRLVAHRVVQHYNLQSSVADSSIPESARIIARKTADTRFPRIRLADIPLGTQSDEKEVFFTQQRIELKRRPNRFSRNVRELNGPVEVSSKPNPAKSVEERKEEYNRARARIFSNVEVGGKQVGESPAIGSMPGVDSYSNNCFRYDKKLEQTSDPISRAEILSVSARTGNSKQERERDLTAVQRGNGRVAIFRDREKDRKDPDYDRNYDRYMQRFDPGFGVVSQAPPYGVQAMYSPVVNYNTEFPQLGGPAVRGQVRVEASVPRVAPTPVRGHLGSSQSAGVYMHPQQYARAGATMAYPPSQERFSHPISQSHVQSEGSLSQARRQ